MSRTLILRVLESEELRRHPPVLVDVGASGEVHDAWSPIARWSIGVGFDPDSRERPANDPIARAFREWHFVPSIVSPGRSGPQTLYLTKSPFCSSTLKPLADELAHYTFSDLFTVVGTTTVPSTTLAEALAKLDLSHIDWLKVDTQGTDCQIVESLPPRVRNSLLVVDLEPGVMRAYESEDTLAKVLASFESSTFWCSSLSVLGPVRGSRTVLSNYLPGMPQRHYDRTERPAAGWVNIQYMNSFRDPETVTVRNLLLGWVLATLQRFHPFALELADLGIRRFGDERFSLLAEASAAGIRGRVRWSRGTRLLRTMGRLFTRPFRAA
jgi:hypothetical protein